jgi:hypothetical protein
MDNISKGDNILLPIGKYASKTEDEVLKTYLSGVQYINRVGY